MEEITASRVFIQRHCEDERCSLNTLIFSCPECEKPLSDVENIDIFKKDGTSHFKCPSCKGKLMMATLDKEIGSLMVIKDLIFKEEN